MVDEGDRVFIKAERYVAKVRGKIEMTKYAILLEGVHRLMLVELSHGSHGKIDPAFDEVTYREEDLEKDLFEPEDILGGETILVHLASRTEAVVRWQILPDPG